MLARGVFLWKILTETLAEVNFIRLCTTSSTGNFKPFMIVSCILTSTKCNFECCDFSFFKATIDSDDRFVLWLPGRLFLSSFFDSAFSRIESLSKSYISSSSLDDDSQRLFFHLLTFGYFSAFFFFALSRRGATIITIDVIMFLLLLLRKIHIYDIVIIGYYLGWYSFFSC